ncbi:MAG: hypothetical protein CVU11_07750 [Bacteroidetes bacterium HGW-Bacteroidetes-6]|jgi:hypothetical protein|nr:MAG: hypothetical protein CVU11_07750 [Bacteroidetes bacterium HGW-Bacteroidetes-6]
MFLLNAKFFRLGCEILIWGGSRRTTGCLAIAGEEMRSEKGGDFCRVTQKFFKSGNAESRTIRAENIPRVTGRLSFTF